MKKYLATILLVFCISSAFAQSQDNNTDSRRYYCEIKCYENSIKSSSAVIFDFGDAVSLEIWGCKSRKLKFVDENGKILSWNDPRTAKERSKTFQGIADAMADQWGTL